MLPRGLLSGSRLASHQLPVLHVLCVDHAAQGIDKDVVVLAVAVPPLKFFQVLVQVAYPRPGGRLQ